MKDEQASSTALLIAASLVFMHEHELYPDAVSDLAADLSTRVLQEHSRKSRFFLRLLRRRWFRAAAEAIERATVPGILRHYAMRKQCIARLAHESVRNEIRQVVVLGAGFDALALRLHNEFPDAQIWEVDHPATQRHKKAALGTVDRSRFHFLDANLSAADLGKQLSALPNFRSDHKTLWIAEGLLMYFPTPIVMNLFKQTQQISAPSSRFIFTFMEPDSKGRVRFRSQTKLVDLWLRFQGEPFRWGIKRESVEELISPWRVIRIYDESDLRKLGSQPPQATLAAGELICLAEN